MSPLPLGLRMVLASFVAMAAALACLPARADTLPDAAAAVTAATAQAGRWLASLDAGRYDEAWDDLASVMKQARSREDVVEEITGPRQHFGKPLMRTLQRADYATTVRGAPAGNYVTASYLSQFSNAPPVREMVLLTLEDGQWRIGGYSAGLAPNAGTPAAPTDQAPAGAKPGG